MRRIHPHRLQYQDDYTPYSGVYDDVFFLAQKGISESTYVYLEGARVAEGIRLGQAKIRIAEIGFGVGLNFLLTLRCFLENSKDHQTLYYFSVEKHPVLKDSLKELYSRYPELKREAELLLENYPHLTPGFHHISLLNGRVILFLMFGDAHELLSRLELSKENLIQHWYWDGFSPSKNADAFSEKIFEQVARLSNTGAIGASFTAAGWVRRNLEDIGYVIQKRPGFGHKRECIQAIFSSRPSSSVTSLLPPWFSEEKLNRLKKGDRIAVLGAGLAGSAIASALASRGYEVDVYDPNGIANGASGNKAGLFNAQLSKLPNPISRFSQLALVHFLRELKRIDIPAHFGIFRQGKDEMTALTNSEYPENFFEEKDGGVLLPECGFIQPHTLCKKRLDHPKIRLHHLAINTVKKNTDGKFELFQETKKIAEADHVVYAVGADLQYFKHTELNKLPTRPIRGQTLQIKPNKDSLSQNLTLVEQGYFTPVASNVTGVDEHMLGATFQAKEILPNQEEADTDALFKELQTKWYPSMTREQIVSLRVGFRLSTPDKLPLIGPVCDEHWMRSHYEHCFQGAKNTTAQNLEPKVNEWMLLGLGSRGITFSSLGAELLAALMCNEPLPIEADLWEHLHTARFFIRKLKKKDKL